MISAFYEPSALKKPYWSTTTNTLFMPPYTCHCAPVLATVDVFSVNDQEPSLPPAVKASQEMGSRIRRSWKLAFSPRRSPLQVTLWEASGSVSPGQASHLQGPDWESITGSGWEHEVVGWREVGAQTIDEKLQACGSPDAWPGYTYTPLIHT